MLRYASFNIYVGNKHPGRNIARMLKATGRPHVVALQEASRWLGSVDGYVPVRASTEEVPGAPARDRLSTMVLVRDDVRIRKVEARQVPGGAWSWNGNDRVPRVWVRVVIEHGGEVSEFWALHRCPGGPHPGILGNRDAWDAEHDFLVRWAGRVLSYQKARTIVLGGDWNTWPGKDRAHPRSIEALAADLDATVHLKHIDGFLVVNGDTVARGAKGVTTRKLARKFGSDGHRPVVMGPK